MTLAPGRDLISQRFATESNVAGASELVGAIWIFTVRYLTDGR